MINQYALEEQMRQRVEDLRRAAEDARVVSEARRAARRASDQIVRPADSQYGARILRLRSLPAWSRGSSDTKSTERGRL